MSNAIPPEARKVFSGIIFDVYQWEQELFDGSSATFERLKRPDTVVVIALTQEGKILITEEQQPTKPLFISLPGGRIDPGEIKEKAAERELLEETGYKAEKLELFETLSPVSKIDWNIYFFIARGCTQVREQKLDPGERIRVKAVSFEAFLDCALDKRFHETNITMRVLQAKLDPQKMTELRALLAP